METESRDLWCKEMGKLEGSEMSMRTGIHLLKTIAEFEIRKLQVINCPSLCTFV